MWSTAEGNSKPLQYSWLENTMNNMKRPKKKKKMTPEDESPQVDRYPICYWRKAEK